MARSKTTWKDVWKEVVIFATAIAVAAAAWILISGLNRRAREKAQMEMERQRMLAAESEAKKEKLRIEREEKERVERVRREKELAEKKAREAEEKRIKEEKDGYARRYAAFMDGFRRVKLDYWRNAPAEEKRLRKEEECVYVCFVAHPVEGNVLSETKSHPGEKLECARMFPDKAPEPISEEDYNAYIRGGTYFVVRSIAGQPADTAFLSFSESETDTRRVMVREGETFNPSRIELKGLYEAFGNVGAKSATLRSATRFRARRSRDSSRSSSTTASWRRGVRRWCRSQRELLPVRLRRSGTTRRFRKRRSAGAVRLASTMGRAFRGRVVII